MTDFEAHYELRSEIVGALEKDLLGGPEDSVIPEAPLDRYMSGILYPLSIDESGELGSATAMDEATEDDGAASDR